MLPIHLHALFGPLPGPPHQHLLGSGHSGTLEEIHAPPQCLLDPVCTLVLSAVARVQPQVRKAGKLPICSSQKRLDPLIIHHFGTVWTFTLSTKPSVSTRADDAFNAFYLRDPLKPDIFSAQRRPPQRLAI